MREPRDRAICVLKRPLTVWGCSIPNHTQPANDYNDENLFVIGSVFPKVENIEVDAAECRALAQHMKAEIERIIAGSKKYTP